MVRALRPHQEIALLGIHHLAVRHHELHRPHRHMLADIGVDSGFFAQFAPDGEGRRYGACEQHDLV